MRNMKGPGYGPGLGPYQVRQVIYGGEAGPVRQDKIPPTQFTPHSFISFTHRL